MNRELQENDNQFIEKVNQIKEQCNRKMEETEAFAFLAVQEAKVLLPLLDVLGLLLIIFFVFVFVFFLFLFLFFFPCSTGKRKRLDIKINRA